MNGGRQVELVEQREAIGRVDAVVVVAYHNLFSSRPNHEKASGLEVMDEQVE